MKKLVYGMVLLALSFFAADALFSDDFALCLRNTAALAEEMSEEAPTADAEQPEMPERQKSPFIGVTDHDCSNNELQAYEEDHSVIDGNLLKMTAERLDGGYVSGKIESKMAFRYGTFTFQVNTMKGTGLFPAIWLLPLYDSRYPEIDIYELVGSAPNEVYVVLHDFRAGQKLRNFYVHKFPEDDVPETCTVKFVWEPDRIEWYINGEKMYSVSKNVPNMPMYLITNLAVGGNWPGSPTKATVFPATFEVEVLEFEPREIFIR